MRQWLVLRLFILGLFTLGGNAVANDKDIGDAVSIALASESRPKSDLALDSLRHPAGVLSFLQIKPGMAVFDIFAGGGYYTEILSHLVGAKGKVVHYNNAPWAAFVKSATEKRFEGDRLANVERLVTPPEALADHLPEYDAAIFVLGMHDIYYADPDTGWVSIDQSKFLNGMFNLLKPGGVLGVIDHNAVTGSDPSVVGESVHRVDPDVVIRDLKKVGFVLEAESDLLANPQDDKTTNVFLPENRYKTDRSLLRFRKPKT